MARDAGARAARVMGVRETGAGEEIEPNPSVRAGSPVVVVPIPTAGEAVTVVVVSAIVVARSGARLLIVIVGGHDRAVTGRVVTSTGARRRHEMEGTRSAGTTAPDGVVGTTGETTGELMDDTADTACGTALVLTTAAP